MIVAHPRTLGLDARHFPSHMHNVFEILYFAEGDADYMMEGTVYGLQKHDLLMIKPRTYHNLLPRSNAYYERFIVFFSPSDVGADIFAKASALPDVVSAASEPLVTGFFDSWSRYGGAMSESELHEFVAAGIKAIVTALFFDEPRQQPIIRRTDALLKSVIEYVDSHPDQSVTVDAIAKMFYLSPSWLTHMFRRKMGISLMRYAEQKRILYAQKLISEGTPPTKAAELCGYENYSTFFRQYKKRLGISPREHKSHII